jgi:hypothetical protein
MTTKSDWLEHSHEKLNDQANATVDYLTAGSNLQKLGISGAALDWFNDVVMMKVLAYNIAYTAWKNPAERTPAKTAAFLAAEADFVAVYRKLYTGYLKNNPLVTDEDLVNMGLPKHSSGGRTPPTPPTTIVEVTVDTSIPATIILNYRNKNEKGTAKPPRVHGVEIRYEILDEPPQDWEQLKNSSFDTRTPAKLVFKGEDRGKTVYFALRWENNVGEKGPWGEIYSAIIP